MACYCPVLRPHLQVTPLGLDLEMPRFTVKNECMSLSSVSLWLRQRSGGTLCNLVGGLLEVLAHEQDRCMHTASLEAHAQSPAAPVQCVFDIACRST